MTLRGEAAIIYYITGGVEPELPSQIMDAYAEYHFIGKVA
jgi:hypothetical protein